MRYIKKSRTPPENPTVVTYLGPAPHGFLRIRVGTTEQHISLLYNNLYEYGVRPPGNEPRRRRHTRKNRSRSRSRSRN
jgi:hypothetical protein